jgi:hypothetical protein
MGGWRFNGMLEIMIFRLSVEAYLRHGKHCAERMPFWMEQSYFLKSRDQGKVSLDAILSTFLLS